MYNQFDQTTITERDAAKHNLFIMAHHTPAIPGDHDDGMKMNPAEILARENQHPTTPDHELIVQAGRQQPSSKHLNFGQSFADKIVRFGGSWQYIVIFLALLCVWIIYNVVALMTYSFDPYPFNFLNLILTCMAALQAPVIMMSRNWQDEKDRLRTEIDHRINYKAELQIRSLHRKMDVGVSERLSEIMEHQKALQALMLELSSNPSSIRPFIPRSS